MKYIPTVDLWADGVQEALRDGSLRLQTGQWVQCGPLGPKDYRSRWDHVTPGGRVLVVHHGPHATRNLFAVCRANRATKAFLASCEARREAERKADEALAEVVRRRTLQENLRRGWMQVNAEPGAGC